MNKEQILRICFSFSSEALLLHFAGEPLRLVLKSDLVRELSDLDSSSERLPTRPLRSESDIELIYSRFSIEHEGQKCLPVIDDNFELEGLWERKKAIAMLEDQPEPEKEPEQAEYETQARAEIKEKEPEKRSESQPSPEQSTPGRPQQHDNFMPPENLLNEEERLSLAQIMKDEDDEEENEDEDLSGNAQKQSSTSRLKHEIEIGRLAIATIEALTIPMLALSRSGETLFFNHDWKESHLENRTALNHNDLMTTAKELMAEAALDGTLDIDNPIEITGRLKGRVIKVRPVRKQPGSHDTAGYLFWIEDEISVREHRVESADTVYRKYAVDGSRYKNRTLPDLLEEEEKKIILWAMKQTDNNQSDAAMLVGIPRQTFSYKYRKYFKKMPRGRGTS